MLHPESVACLKCIGKPLLASEDKTGFTHLLAFFWMLGMRLFVFCSKSKLLTLTSHYGTHHFPVARHIIPTSISNSYTINRRILNKLVGENDIRAGQF